MKRLADATDAEGGAVASGFHDFIVDFTDLITHFEHSRLLSGIQRVVVALGRSALQKGAEAAIFDEATSSWKALGIARLDKLLDLASSGGSETGLWEDCLAEIRRAIIVAAPQPFSRGSILVSLGANWSANNFFVSIRSLRRHFGVRFVPFIHDTVPLDLPEYCSGDVSKRFRSWFYACILHSDLLITNSNATAMCVRRACDEVGLRMPPHEVCGLGGAPETIGSGSTEPGPRIRSILQAGFVLFVATLEPRKDHLTVISAWRTLAETLGATLPTLVLVGTRGWRNEPVMEAIKDPRIRDKTIVLSDLNGDDLDWLYRKCSFTIYNSAFEGWGLPVSESIAYGKVPVVPQHSGLIESGAGCAEFFRPFDRQDLADKVLKLLREPQYLMERTKEVQRVVLPTWQNIASDLFSNLQKRLAQAEAPLLPGLALGSVYSFRSPPANASLTALRQAAITEACRGEGWHFFEWWGCWTAKQHVEMIAVVLEDQSEPHASTSESEDELAIFLSLRGHHSPCSVHFTDGNGESLGHYNAAAQERAVLRLRCTQRSGSRLVLNLEQSALSHLSSLTTNEDTRTIGLGLEAFMVCRQSDDYAKCRFYESFLRVEIVEA